VRVVVHSDLHADHVTMGVSRRDDAYRALVAVRNEAKGAEVVFFLGDLSDPEDGPAALRAASMLAEHAVKVADGGAQFVAIPGNHDVFEDGSGDSTLDVLLSIDLPEVHLLFEPVAVTFDRTTKDAFNVVALPFSATSHAYDPDAFVREVVGHPDRYGLVNTAPTFVIGHLQVPGVQPGEETKELPRGREVLFPFAAVASLIDRMKGPVVVMNGHYHRRQDFTAPQGYAIHIPGSTARLTMGEERHEPSYLVIEV
jgi:DNA repair exonuclease SbcCD nuclease subunit